MFGRIQDYVEYRPMKHGIEAVFVKPYNTSKKCSFIGCEHSSNTNTQSHWYRKNVPAEEIARDSDIYTAEHYREQISDDQMAFSMTIRYETTGWTVSFTAPSIRKGMGDRDNRYSMRSGSLEEAIAHIEIMFEQKGPTDNPS